MVWKKTEQTFWLIQQIIVIKRAIFTCIDIVRTTTKKKPNEKTVRRPYIL